MTKGATGLYGGDVVVGVVVVTVVVVGVVTVVVETQYCPAKPVPSGQ